MSSSRSDASTSSAGNIDPPDDEQVGEDKARFLGDKAAQIRQDVLSVAIRNKAGHIAPSLSCLEILVALYYDVMQHRPGDPAWQSRDRLIFSKAHGAYALYAILADLKMLPRGEWENFYTCESTLMGCLERRLEYGIEASCGSLGHGLPLAVGTAWGLRFRRIPSHVFCLMGDGELQEGTTWEAVQFARKYALDNLTIIIDRNRLQAMDFILNVLDRDDSDLPQRFVGFGLSPQSVPGHDAAGLAECLRRAKNASRGVPSVVLAETVKGYGCPCMENVPKFHFRLPTPEELRGES